MVPAWHKEEKEKMKIIKILNKNLVFARDDAGQEVVVKGLGIGFHASRGELVDQSRISQIFYPQPRQNVQQMMDFLMSIPEEYLNFVQEFVDAIKSREKINFNSSIYLSQRPPAGHPQAVPGGDVFAEYAAAGDQAAV